jgi:hypothetical protein
LLADVTGVSFGHGWIIPSVGDWNPCAILGIVGMNIVF